MVLRLLPIARGTQSSLLMDSQRLDGRLGVAYSVMRCSVLLSKPGSGVLTPLEYLTEPVTYLTIGQSKSVA